MPDFENQLEFVVSDNAIREFLLAQLDPQRQSAFETSLFSNDYLEQRVRLAEYELADDYVYGGLNHSDEKSFEHAFLVTTDRKNQLKVSQALHDRFGSPVSARSSLMNGFAADISRWPFNSRPWAWRAVFAVFIFLLLVGTAWLVLKKEPRIREEITKRVQRARSAVQPPFEANHPGATSTPQHATPSSPLPEHTPSVPSPVVIYLEPAKSRDSGVIQTIALPPSNEAVVRFELAVRIDATMNYRANFLTAQGESIFAANAALSTDKVTVEVPARLLRQGQFHINLTDARSKVTVANYYFRVP